MLARNIITVLTIICSIEVAYIYATSIDRDQEFPIIDGIDKGEAEIGKDLEQVEYEAKGIISDIRKCVGTVIDGLRGLIEKIFKDLVPLPKGETENFEERSIVDAIGDGVKLVNQFRECIENAIKPKL